MHILKIALLTILVLMSLVAGVAKIMQMPQELKFLSHLGLEQTAVIVLGAVQSLGGLLLLLPQARRVGALLAILALTVSGLALFTSGNSSVGLITLFPIAIGISIFFDEKPGQSRA